MHYKSALSNNSLVCYPTVRYVADIHPSPPTNIRKKEKNEKIKNGRKRKKERNLEFVLNSKNFPR